MIGFEVAKYTCDSDPGTISPTIGEIPEDCDVTAGVFFTIEVAGGDTLFCTTDATGICNVQVPNGATATVTEDTSTSPAGFSPREKPIEVEAMTEFAGAVFVNLPHQPAQLPETGTGTALADGPSLANVLAAATATSLVAAGHFIRRFADR